MKKILFTTIIFGFFIFFGSVSFVFADQEITVKPNPIPCVPNLPCIQKSTQQKGGREIRKYITDTFGVKFFKSFLGLTAATSVIFIIVGGFQLHTALGNEEALGKAKKTLIWAISGLIISILAVAIVQIISKLPFQ